MRSFLCYGDVIIGKAISWLTSQNRRRHGPSSLVHYMEIHEPYCSAALRRSRRTGHPSDEDNARMFQTVLLKRDVLNGKGSTAKRL